MRKSLLLLGLIAGLTTATRSPGQVPDPGVDQDAQAAREKLLKASDELDNIQANSESTKVTLDAMKPEVATLQSTIAQLQTDNAALKQQLADMQTAFDQYKADQAQARKSLIDNVAGMIAEAGKGTSKTKKRKETTDAATDGPAPSTDTATKPIPSNLLPPPDPNSPAPTTSATTSTPDATPPVKPGKGYYHVVASGETLTMICAAYRDNGVNVTASEVRKANGLTADSTLKAGQKLFIPKPGT